MESTAGTEHVEVSETLRWRKLKIMMDPGLLAMMAFFVLLDV